MLIPPMDTTIHSPNRPTCLPRVLAPLSPPSVGQRVERACQYLNPRDGVFDARELLRRVAPSVLALHEDHRYLAACRHHLAIVACTAVHGHCRDTLHLCGAFEEAHRFRIAD